MAITDELLNALRLVESNGNPNARSPAGALGAYQFMPGTAKQFGIDPLDEGQSREAARKYLTQLHNQFGSVEKALQAYNWGPGNMAAFERTGTGAKGQPMPAETQAYAPKVLSKAGAQPAGRDLLKELSGGGEVEQAGPRDLLKELSAGEGAKPEVSMPKRALGAIVRGAGDLLLGSNQLGARAIEAAMPGGSRAEALARAWREKIDSANTSLEQDYQQNYGGQGQGLDLPRLGANVAFSAPLAMAAPAGAALGIAGKTALGALTGGVFGALQPVMQGDFWKEKAKQAGLGAAGGAVLTPVAAGVGRLVSPKTSPQVQALMREGVTPTPGQILGGVAKRVEEGATSIPIFGDFIKGSQRRAVGEMNAAAINRSLAPIGEKLPSGVSGRDAIEFAGTTLSNRYNAILDKIGAAPVDDAMLNDLASLSIKANMLPKDKGEQLGRIIDAEILGRVTDGRMTGEAVKAAEANLGSLGRSYLKAPDYDTRHLGTAIVEAQNTLRKWLERAAPEQAPALKAANTGWANFLRVQRAAGYVGADGGVFSAANLNSAIKAADTSRNKGAYASGRALMQDLGDNAKAVLGQSVPDSGTPFRAANMAMAAASLAEPTIAGGAVAGGMMYTAPMQKALAALLTKRPELAKPIAEGLLRLPGPGAAAISPLLAPLLDYRP